MAGVANTGSDAQLVRPRLRPGQLVRASAGWPGTPALAARAIADEWIRDDAGPTTRAPSRRDPRMMLGVARGRRRLHDAARPAPPDRPATTTAPMPWMDPDPRRADWIGDLLPPRRRDGASASTGTARGSNAVGQYRSPVARAVGTTSPTSPENLLLWFHRAAVGLPARVRAARSGTGWCGITGAAPRRPRQMVATWESLRGKIDEERHRAVLAKLRVQASDAAAWRDKCLRYFQQFSGAAAISGGDSIRRCDPIGASRWHNLKHRLPRQREDRATRWATSRPTSSSSR
ncbi:MAG: hypothetical protein MZV63_15975 [Marinilabiliales bacterium]|nr:hypothetical protein [Marinilabiliales bacterium]